MELRPYQEAARSRRRLLWLSGARSVLEIAPTGAGKTCSFSEMAARHLPKRTLVVAPRREILNQTFDKMTMFGVPPDAMGMLMGGASRDLTRPIQISTWDTLSLMKGGDLPPATRLIVDEAHLSITDQRLEIIRRYLDLPGVYASGFTATPWRADGKSLGLAFQAISVHTTVRELQESGWLAGCIAYTIPKSKRPDVSKVPIANDGEYDAVKMDAALVDHDLLMDAKGKPRLVGNIIDEYRKNCDGALGILFAVSIRQSKEHAAEFCAAGIPARHIDGMAGSEEREEVLGNPRKKKIGMLERGAIKILCNVDVCSEGFDAPMVKCIILASISASISKYLQRVGRGLRPWFDDRCTIIDPCGNVERHGLPQRDREYRLDGVQRAQRASESAGRTCSKCYAIAELWETHCPGCGVLLRGQAKGRPRMIKNEEGELVEYREDGGLPTEDEKKAYWERLCHVPFFQKNPGAALGAFRKKHGHFPPLGWRRKL